MPACTAARIVRKTGAAWLFFLPILLSGNLLADEVVPVKQGVSGHTAAWLDLVGRNIDVEESVAIARAGEFFRRFPKRSDRVLWGVVEYWAEPAELLRVGAGDCEDIALAMYYTLRTLGVDADRLWLGFGKAWNSQTRKIEAHVVLLYRPNKDDAVYVYDSLDSRLVALAERTDVALEYVFNESGAWLYIEESRGGTPDPVIPSVETSVDRENPLFQKVLKLQALLYSNPVRLSN